MSFDKDVNLDQGTATRKPDQVVKDEVTPKVVKEPKLVKVKDSPKSSEEPVKVNEGTKEEE